MSVPGNGGCRHRLGIRIHRVALEPWETMVVDAIPVTTPARTLLDLSAGASPNTISDLITRTEQLRLYDHRQVLACLAAHPRHPGATRLRAALAVYQESPLTDSELERLFLAICARIGLPTPLTQRPDGAQRLDFLWPDHGLIVEVDGWGTHGTRRAFEDDRARDAEHTAQGLRTIRFTYRQLTERAEWVAEILRRALSPRRP